MKRDEWVAALVMTIFAIAGCVLLRGIVAAVFS